MRWLVVLVCAALGCGSLDDEVRTMFVDGATQLTAGQTIMWTAQAQRYDGTLIDITADAQWSTDNPAVARADAGGVVTGVKQGTATVSAAYATLHRDITVIVGPPALTQIELDTVPPIPVGVARQLTVFGQFSDGSMREVTELAAWSSSDPATVTVSDQGVAHADTVGSATVTATIAGLVATTAVEVSTATIATIDLSPPDTTLPAGRNRAYTATGHFTDGSVVDLTDQVTWDSSDPTIATITTDGNAHARSEGTTTISARFDTGYGSLDLQVTSPEVDSLAIVPASVMIPAGFAERLVAIGTYSTGARLDITAQVAWTSTDLAIATVDSAPATRGTAHGIAAGDTLIKATYNGLTASVAVHVTTAQLMSLAITRPSAKIPVKYGDDLVATGTFDDGSMEDLTTQVTWTSSAPAITVTSAGRARAAAAGTATITAGRDGKQATTMITGVAATISNLSVTPPTANLTIGQSVQLTATGTFTDGAQYPLSDDVTWVSFTVRVASVTQRGKVVSQRVGTTTVSGTDPNMSSKSDSTIVTVSE